MSAKHTPGPWTLETVGTSCGICHKIGPFPWTHGRKNHACIYGDYPGKGSLAQELQANAHLIAAAPDLLEALEDFKERVINWECEFLQDPQWSWDKINAAIDKAKGMQP